ncbi:hypothetical protein HZU38_05250 [Mycolicibacterium vanbaalenii]|uniref:hypothetical protein n=1 Tax=Mycolicibacterium vanbaalenii TaxID=110539 RepID=UPI001F3D2104|nr:hypothetical protein [Mycolicibacterium vanbaalenii]UJL29909.1 hypothetical protein HZU38_05250 [Mycolicibacterium vanbaalenii]WND57030.1 hypothetical protein QQA43_01020 [Mycolicibacterium vanbaalenii]
MAYDPPSQPGQHHPKIPGAKRFLARYSYGKGLGDTDEYTIAFGVALRTWAPRFNAEIDKGRAGPRVPVDGSFNWAVIRQMGLDEKPGTTLKPLVLTCMGHMGGMTAGPDYHAARPLEERGQVQIQMVGGFNNDQIPFQLGPQRAQIDRLLHEPQLRVLERDWAVSAHSRGAMAFCHYYMERDPSDPIWRRFKGGLMFGNPNRPAGTVAQWIADKPDPDTEGLSPYCLPEPIPGVAEVSRKNDLYADKKIGVKASELKVAIIKLVAYGELFGKDSITEELLDLALRFGQVVWSLFAALTDGIQFAFNMRPHNEFDLAPAERHLAAILGV